MELQKSSMIFRVTRRTQELIAPAKPTPYEYKLLSDIDDQEGLRFQIPVIQFYKKNNHSFLGAQELDPVKVFRNALSKALVFYYPFAGRLREGYGRKLAVECTGEGVMFIEADADVTLEDFGDALQPPFPCLEELVFDVPGSTSVLGCPVLLIQVTRLKCGGFILAYRVNHTMCDAGGLFQFMNALSEIARGASAPSVPPVWKREILNARVPPRITCTHREYDQVADTKGTIIRTLDNDLVHRSFLFGPTEIRALRKLVPPHLRTCSFFELLTACLWRSRTRSLQPDPEEEVRVLCIVNARAGFRPPLPVGYYGNVLMFPVALTTSGKLCENPIGYALELVRKTKEGVSEEYMRSVADLLVLRGRPHFTTVRTFLVSDLTHAGLGDVDYGWGKPAYGGPGIGGVGAIPSINPSFYIPFKNKRGENGITVPVCLPASAMDKFVVELDNMLNNKEQQVIGNASLRITSPI